MKKSRVELHSALVHVRYTIDQLISTIYWHKLEGKLPLDVTQKAIFANACWESSLVSLRVLNEFFTPEKTKDRITASHYPGYSTSGAFLSQPDVQWLNDHLAHLTWQRLKEPTSPWQHRLFLSALGPCRDFLQYLIRDFLSTTDSEHAPISQELEAIELYLARVRTVENSV
ncbi:MAG: hypothetical protein QOI07_1897 [Verrucomicrobiota bacterium]|jgi:hypothetical protein